MTTSRLIIFILLISFIGGLIISRFEVRSVFIIVGVVLSLIVLLNTYWGLFIIIMLFPFMVGFSEGVDAVEQAFTVLFSLLLIGWLTRLLLDRSEKWHFGWHPVSKPTLAIGALLAMAAVIGLLNGASFIDVFRDLSQFVGYLIMLPVLGVVRSRKAALRLLIIVLLIGLPCYIFSSFVWRARKFGIEYGSLNVALVGSAYWGPIMGALWPLTLLRTERRKRLLAGIALLLLLFFTLGSGYRHRLIAMIVMTCVATWGIWAIQSGKRRMVVAIPVIIGGCFLFWVIGGTLGHLPLPGGDRARSLYSTLLSPQALLSDDSVQGRLIESQVALGVFWKNPLFGQGLGHHVEFLRKGRLWWYGGFGQHVWPTAMLMKFGAAGACVFIWYFISILRFSFIVAKKVNKPMIKAIALGIFVWIIMFLVPTVGSISNRGFAFMVGLTIGILPALAGQHPYGQKIVNRELR